jgi:glyoxylase-like metal-dependent hydrolase (beta-lactamase superfamily II)
MMMNGTSDSRYPAEFSLLKNSKTTLIDNDRDEYDVFGDGTVIIKSTPGHTPGHQVLFVKLKKSQPVVLAGDLYHYPEEIGTTITPKNDVDAAATLKSRKELDAFMKKHNAQLWIQHDLAAFEKLKKGPQFYE